MTDRGLPANLQRVLDEIPISVLCQYLGVRLEQTTGKREIRISLRDGAYQGGRVVIPFGELR